MSKKTRKKSSKPSTGKTTRAQSATSAKTAPSKTRGAAAAKPSKKAKNRQPGKATVKALHKAPSKKLKSSGAAKSAPNAITAPKATAAKPAVAKSAAAKPIVVAKPAVVTKPAVADLPIRTPAGEKAGGLATPRSALSEGAKAPAFSLPRDGGSTVSLADYAGQKLVLFFYPRADTPGCTKEAIDFTRLASAFASAQTAVLGVSADPLKAQESFRNKYQLSTPLISDERHEMLEAYGVWGEKPMYGRIFLGVLRTTVLIGANGRVMRIWRNVKVDGHADEVLAAAQAG